MRRQFQFWLCRQEWESNPSRRIEFSGLISDRSNWSWNTYINKTHLLHQNLFTLQKTLQNFHLFSRISNSSNFQSSRTLVPRTFQDLLACGDLGKYFIFPWLLSLCSHISHIMNSYSPLHLTVCNREFWKRNLRKTQFIACVNPMIFLWFHLLPRNCSHDHSFGKNLRISQKEQSLGHPFSFACSWFPKTAGFMALGLLRMMNPDSAVQWAEINKNSPRMFESTAY